MPYIEKIDLNTRFTSLDSFFEPTRNRVHLYKVEDNFAVKWMLDNDLDDFNGFYSLGIDWQTSNTLPTGVDVWFTTGPDDSQFAENLQLITIEKFTAACEDYSHVTSAREWLLTVSCGCSILDRGLCANTDVADCSTFILRYKYTDLCIVRIEENLVVRQCSIEYLEAQNWYFNSNTATLEGLTTLRSSVKLHSQDDTQNQYFIAVNQGNPLNHFISPAKTTKVCASEGDTCTCDGTVFYGRVGSYVNTKELGNYHEQVVSGTVTCENAFFGSDPDVGSTKQCWCIQAKASSFETYFANEDDYDVLILKEAGIEYCFSKNPIPGIPPQLILESSGECTSFRLY